MKTVKVDRKQLLERVKANCAKHREVFEKALANYREFVIEELESMIDDARSNKPIRTIVNLQAPVDHTKDYERVIDMLEMSVNEVIELDEEHFAMYVRDEWHWSQTVAHLNTSYANKMKPTM